MSFILIAVLIDMMAIGLIIPVLPALVGSFANSQTNQALAYGLVTFAFGLATFLSSPLLGGLSDQYGRRRVLLLGFMGLAFSFFATALVSALWMLVLVRIVSGSMQANAAIANAYVADITAPEQRAKRFGLLGAMTGLGFIIGPVLGGLLGTIDIRLPFYVAGTLALLNLVYGYFVLPESLPAERRTKLDLRKSNPLSSIRTLAQLKGIGPLVWVIVFSGLAQFVLYTSWVLYTTFKFGWGPKENGWSLATVGICSVLVQGVLLGPMLKRFSASRLVVFGLISSAIAHFFWGLASEGWMMFAIIGANIFGFAVTAAVQSLVSNAADSKSQGQTFAAVSALSSLMAVLAPLLVTPLLAAVSHLPKGDWRIGAPMYFCALLQLGALYFARKHFRQGQGNKGL
jgi:MFS transporter, DHA1 family, tetracycline resistance protein